MKEEIKNSGIAPVELSDYDPGWIERFNKAKEEIDLAVGEYLVAIEHIGSTSIPGLSAKPEIDVMAGVEKLENADKCIDSLSSIRYLYYKKFEEFVPERRYFRKSEGITPLVHVHMVEISSDFWKEHLAFRDYLRNHPEAVKEYENLKKDLLTSSGGDRGIYQDGKIKFIKDIIERAQKNERRDK